MSGELNRDRLRRKAKAIGYPVRKLRGYPGGYGLINGGTTSVPRGMHDANTSNVDGLGGFRQ